MTRQHKSRGKQLYKQETWEEIGKGATGGERVRQCLPVGGVGENQLDVCSMFR